MWPSTSNTVGESVSPKFCVKESPVRSGKKNYGQVLCDLFLHHMEIRMSEGLNAAGNEYWKKATA
jgi:hypothetical protein